MKVDFDVTGPCPRCGTKMTGIAKHNAYGRKHRVADTGIFGWSPCPSGCPEWYTPDTVIYVGIRTTLEKEETK